MTIGRTPNGHVWRLTIVYINLSTYLDSLTSIEVIIMLVIITFPCEHCTSPQSNNKIITSIV